MAMRPSPKSGRSSIMQRGTVKGAGMPDPVTFSALGGLAASGGINFLYGQARNC